MGPDQLVFFWLILSTLALCALLFGIRYFNNRENMAMIEKGLDPKLKPERRPAPFRNLKWGLLMAGSGIGLFLAYFLDNFILLSTRHRVPNEFDNDANVPIYFALIAIGGGIGLILSYRIERKHFPDQN
ncbi:MAG TPA: hypothetical protein DIC22_06425 [Chitinophagaceae bacterium]|jgi:hypothetical protein|nr:hypothetical protein [Chitinophagaceae bacterium]